VLYVFYHLVLVLFAFIVVGLVSVVKSTLKATTFIFLVVVNLQYIFA